MNCKILAFDLDGTLLTSKKTISNRTIEVLKKASNMGIECVPCTGRFYDAIPKCIKDLDFVNYSININGASVYDVNNKQSIFSYEMDKELAIKAYDYLKELDVICDAYVDNWGYMSVNDYAKIEDYVPNKFYVQSMHDYRRQVKDLALYLKSLKTGVQKFQCYTPDGVLLNNIVDYFKNNYPELSVTSSGIVDCELNDINANKGNALLKLSEYLGVNINEVIAFGDGGNDVSMLKVAGVGVATSNAKQIAKDGADVICLSNDEDGVAKYIEEYVF